ncbi:MAG: formylglycine-generating enzyme family protein [Planctomycetaceae bacterium]
MKTIITRFLIAATILISASAVVTVLRADDKPKGGGDAKTEAEMKPYTEEIEGANVEFEMVPIPGGVFTMGSPESEAGREADEGPPHDVKIEPFWMGKYEVSWEEYDVWTFTLDIQRRELKKLAASDRDKLADAVTHPTKPYTDMTFGMGHDGYPAICMTQLAARVYCDWLTAKTGHYYRLPTEAEWEYACRAGTKTAYSFGDDPADLDEYAWHTGNSDYQYQKIGKKKPNPWGLYDMHGNVREWVLDQYDADFYSLFKETKVAEFPINVATKPYAHVVRGGSWDDKPEKLRSAARIFSDPDWKIQDPQIPKSEWYFTDALWVGFRVVRPLTEPTAEEREKYGLDTVIPPTSRKR